MTAAFVTGVVAGLALVVPLGAIGVLLIFEGAARGMRRGAPAALGVATTDLLYCAAAVTAGAAVRPALDRMGHWPRVVAGAVLVLLALVSLVRGRRAKVDAVSEAVPDGGSVRRYLTFIGLTAVNPATLVYFAAVVSGTTAASGSVATAGVFVVGVAIASVVWQLVLVAAGNVVGRRAGRHRASVATVGHCLVAVLGLCMIGGLL